MKNITNPLRALATTIMTKVIVNKPKPRKNLPKHLFLVLTALGALTFGTKSPAAVINYVGSLDTNNVPEVNSWLTPSVPKTYDIDGDNIYGTFAAISWGDYTNYSSSTISFVDIPSNVSLDNQSGFCAQIDQLAGACGGNTGPGVAVIPTYQAAAYRAVANLGNSVLHTNGSSLATAWMWHTFQVNSNLTGKTLRVGIMNFLYGSSGTINPHDQDSGKGVWIAQVAGGSAQSIVAPVNAGQQFSPPGVAAPDMTFFDIVNAQAGDQYRVYATRDLFVRSNPNTYFGTITFDVADTTSVPATLPNINTYVTSGYVNPATLFGTPANPVNGATNYGWNNDGIDITDCSNVSISHCDINSADDGICLKSGASGNYGQGDGFSMFSKGCDHVTINDCRIRSSASALKFGTASFGSFRHIHVSNLTIYDTYRSAVALETVDGGTIEHVLVENIRATNTGNAIFLRLGQRNTNASPGILRDVVIRNLQVEVPAGKPDVGYQTPGPPTKSLHNVIPSSIVGIPNHPVKNVLLENVEIVYSGDANPHLAQVSLEELGRMPEKAQNYPEFSMFGELPAWGFYLRHAEGVEFRNVRLTLKGKDYRSALVCDDVKDFHLKDVTLEPASGEPVVALSDTRDTILQNIVYPEQSKERVRLLGHSSPPEIVVH